MLKGAAVALTAILANVFLKYACYERQIRNKNQADRILHMEDPQHGSSPLFP